jgi:hypothetical protein
LGNGLDLILMTRVRAGRPATAWAEF